MNTERRRKKDWIQYGVGILVTIALGLGAWMWSKFTYQVENFPVMLQRLQYIEKGMDKIESNNKLLNELRVDQIIIKERQVKIIKVLNKLTIMHQLPEQQMPLSRASDKTADTREKLNAN